MLNEFISYLESQVNKAIYVYGAQGQAASMKFIQDHESGRDETRAVALFVKRLDAGIPIDEIKAFDCSGLGMYFLYNLKKLIPTDRNANGMITGNCEKITQDQLKKGDWVGRYSALKRKVVHIGYVVDDQLNVIECKGRDDGVIKRPLSAGGWNRFGRPLVFKAEIEAGQPQFIISRLLKVGVKGADVSELQVRLKANGFDPGKIDGDFGPRTKAAVVAFQTFKGLTPDGVVGKNTIKALGGVLA